MLPTRRRWKLVPSLNVVKTTAKYRWHLQYMLGPQQPGCDIRDGNVSAKLRHDSGFLPPSHSRPRHCRVPHCREGVLTPGLHPDSPFVLVWVFQWNRQWQFSTMSSETKHSLLSVDYMTIESHLYHHCDHWFYMHLQFRAEDMSTTRRWKHNIYSIHVFR